MTAAVFRNTPSLSVPQSQNTAPVLEFNCLYTHDVRKKAKKWQDGVVRYHTFNKRCMVYVVPRNFIGDMHWTGDEDVHEGDELTLESCGVRVEVADCIGRTETDLSELRKSKDKNQSTAAETPPSRTAPPPIARSSIAAPARAGTQLKHRSLNALLGTPKGPIGKAQLPTQSPFEARHANEENEAWEDGRPAKRPKTGGAWNVTRTTTTPKAAKARDPPLWARTSDAAKQKKKPALHAGQQRLGTKEIIALSDDGDNGDEQPANDFLPGFSDDALAHSSSPAKAKQKMTSNANPRSSSPAFQTQQNPPARTSRRVEVPKSVKRTKTMEQASDEDENCVVTHVTSSKEPSAARVDNRLTDGTSLPDPPKSAPAERQRHGVSKTSQTLRLAATAPKKKGLLCQGQLLKSSKKSPSSVSDRTIETPEGDAEKSKQGDRVSNGLTRGKAESARIDVLGVTAEKPQDTAESPKQDDRALKAREQLEARLARIDKKGGSTSSARLKQASKKRVSKQQPTVETSNEHDLTGDVELGDARPDAGSDALTSHQKSALELKRLDDRMLPPPSRRPQTATVRPATVASLSGQPLQKEDRTLRRAISDSNAVSGPKQKRVPGAPVRYTPSPTKRSRESTPAAATSRPTTPTHVPNEPVTHAPASKSFRPRKALQKSVSLNVTSNGTSAVVLGRQFKAPSAKADVTKEPEPEAVKDVGPWSRDAFDLFTWRPPGWDEEQWCVKEDGEKSAPPPIGLSGGVSLPAV